MSLHPQVAALLERAAKSTLPPYWQVPATVARRLYRDVRGPLAPEPPAVESAVLLLAHTLYRVRIVGEKHLPAEGGALLVPNHVSFLDGLFLLAATDRPILAL